MTNAGMPGTPTSTPPVQEQYKLMRARDGRMVAGVAAGLSRACGLDVAVVRICIGVAMLSGIGFAAYILLWIVLPEESPRRGRTVEPAPENTARTIRMVIVGVGILSVLNKFGGLWPFANSHAGHGMGWDGLLGVVLLSAGVGVLFSRHRPDRNWWDQPSSPPATASSPTTMADPAPAGDGVFEPEHYVVDPEDSAEDPPGYVGPFGDVMGTVHDAMTDAFDEVRTTLAETRVGRRRSADRFEPTTPIATVTSNGLVRSGGAALGWARVIGWFLLIWWTLGSIAIYLAWHFDAVRINKPVLLSVASWLVFIAVINTLIHAKFARAVMPALLLLLIPIALGTALVRTEGPGGRPPPAARRHVGHHELSPSDRSAPARLE